MILLTNKNGDSVLVNTVQILWVESLGEGSIIFFSNGDEIIVRESFDSLNKRFVG